MRVAPLALAGMLLLGARADARPLRGRPFDLFAGPHALIRANRVRCNVDRAGELCVDPTNSPITGGGFWPAGTTDQYVFNQGLQFAALLQGPAGSPWNGDTVGAYFFDPRGDQKQGSPLTPIYDALNPADFFRWPRAAFAHDVDLFAPQLIGRHTVSDQDTWQRYWDGNTALGNGRVHPMGMLVDQRTMAWNTPGLEDAVFFVFRLINITATDPAAYQQLASAGYDAAEIADVVGIARTFHDAMAATYGVSLPSAGYTFANAYVGFSQDADVGQAGSNYSNANLIFQAMFAYKSDFREPAWQFPLDIFAPPFASAPGFVAEALVVSPPDTITGAPAGIWMTTNTTDGAPFPDGVGVQRLWRNLSLNLLPSDGTCSFPGQQKVRHYCVLVSTPTDTREFMSTGPTRIPAGGSVMMVIAQVHAAPVDSSPGFSLRPFIGGNMVPGYPLDGVRLFYGQDTIRNVDRAAGWVTHANVNGDTVISPDEVQLVPRSLYWKVRRARAVAAAGFVQPAAPDAPRAYAIPGDNRVTVVWEKSASEVAGDPYFPLASNPANPLYDPDYRKNDVEGYRVWRGHSPTDLQVLAQFDYRGTTFTDQTGQFAQAPDCAPEIGLTAACLPLPLDVPIAGNVVQYRLGDRIRLGNGSVGFVHADTAVTGGATGYPGLGDTGVPFVFVDTTVHNGESWYYAVTAFDVNSARSARSSLESALLPHAVTPRAVSSDHRSSLTITGLFRGDGTPADTATAFPALDSATGVLRGPIPPINGLSLALGPALADALVPGDYGFRVDSVSPGFTPTFGITTPTLYGAFFTPDSSFAVTLSLPTPVFSANSAANLPVSHDLVPYDTAALRSLGVAAPFASQRDVVDAVLAVPPLAFTSPGVALANGRYGVTGTNSGGRFLAHSYWSDAGQVPLPDPTIDPFGSAAHTNGYLRAAGSIWEPLSYRQPIAGGAAAHAIDVTFRQVNAASAAVWYPADIYVTWGAGGSVVVRDSTHGVSLPYKQSLEPGYGFLDLSAMSAAGITGAALADPGFSPSMTALSYMHLYTTRPACGVTRAVACIALAPSATLTGIDVDGDGVSEAPGFVIVINGEPFFIQAPALPATGTVWHLAAWGGGALAATCTPPLPVSSRFIAFGSQPTDCSGYGYVAPPPVRAPFAPGITFRVQVRRQSDSAVSAAGLSAVHTVPDPYYFTNSLETGSQRVLRFVNLPSQAVVRIYSASGILVAILSHRDDTGGGEAVWDLRSRTGRQVASGVYFWLVEAANGARKTGRMLVVNRE